MIIIVRDYFVEAENAEKTPVKIEKSFAFWSCTMCWISKIFNKMDDFIEQW